MSVSNNSSNINTVTPLTLGAGGSNASLTASNGGVVYSNASQLAILAATATAQQLFLSGSSTTPQWSTTTYPLTNAVNTLLWASSNNTMSALATQASSGLLTNGSGVPAWVTATGTGSPVLQSGATLITPASLGVQQQALNMGSFKINAVVDPTSAQDAATKNYVDSLVSGLNPIEACYGASTANLTGFTYLNGASGVGATLTAGSNGAFTQDGIAIPLNQRWLYKNDTTGSGAYNGVYTVTTVGTGSTPAILTRATNYDTPTDINDSGLIPIQFGTANAGTGWLNTATVVSVGITPITYIQFGQLAGIVQPLSGGTGVANLNTSTITLGGPLTLSGAFATVFNITAGTNVTFPTSGTLSTTVGTVTSVSGTTNRITSTGGATPVLDISASYVGQTSLTTLGTITTGVWTGTTIAVANGGTGLTSAANSAILTSTSAGVPVWSASMTNGQVLIGSTGATPTAATLTATDSITITNTAGAITIGGGGSISSNFLLMGG